MARLQVRKPMPCLSKVSKLNSSQKIRFLIKVRKKHLRLLKLPAKFIWKMSAGRMQCFKISLENLAAENVLKRLKSINPMIRPMLIYLTVPMFKILVGRMQLVKEKLPEQPGKVYEWNLSKSMFPATIVIYMRFITERMLKVWGGLIGRETANKLGRPR